jgi:hypothetical protein
MTQATRAVDAQPTYFGKPLDKLVLAYLSCPQDAAKSYLGGLLLTDWRTRPVEFSFVSPVKISLMQRLVHGKTLDEVVVIDVISQRLLGEATKAADVVFVDSGALLQAQRLVEVPVVLLERQAQVSPGSLTAITFKTAESRFSESVARFVTGVETQVDLIDPFARLTDAIREALRSTPSDHQ